MLSGFLFVCFIVGKLLLALFTQLSHHFLREAEMSERVAHSFICLKKVRPPGVRVSLHSNKGPSCFEFCLQVVTALGDTKPVSSQEGGSVPLWLSALSCPAVHPPSSQALRMASSLLCSENPRLREGMLPRRLSFHCAVSSCLLLTVVYFL